MTINPQISRLEYRLKNGVGLIELALKCRRHKDAANGYRAELTARLHRLSITHGQNTLAKDLGISPQYFNDVIRGKRPVTDKLIDSIAAKKGGKSELWQ